MFLYLEHWFKHIFLVFYNGQDVFALFVAFITLIMVRFHWKQTYNLNKFNVKCHNLTFERHPVVFCFLFGLIFMATNIIIFYSIKMVWHIHIFNINSTVAINLTFYIKTKVQNQKITAIVTSVLTLKATDVDTFYYLKNQQFFFSFGLNIINLKNTTFCWGIIFL